jgi:hypothetical protein
MIQSSLDFRVSIEQQGSVTDGKYRVFRKGRFLREAALRVKPGVKKLSF